MHSVHRFAALLLAASAIPASAHATSVVKTATGKISYGSAWAGGSLPSSSDIAVFDGATTVTKATGATFDANGNSSMETWGGLQVTDIHGPLVFNDTSTVTIGSEGIDLSAATADVTFNSGTVRLSTQQAFQIAPGRSLILAGLTAKMNIYTLAVTGGGTLVVTGNAGATGTVRFALDVTGAGTTLAGTGTYRPNNPKDDYGIRVGPGAFVAPGHGGIGALTLSHAGLAANTPLLNMTAGASFKFVLGAASGSTFAAPGRSDQIAIASATPGCVVFAETTLDLLDGGEPGVYRLFKTDLADAKASTWKGLTLDDRLITAGLTITHLADGFVGKLRLGDGAGNGDLDSIYLVVSSAIPEPSAYVAK